MKGVEYTYEKTRKERTILTEHMISCNIIKMITVIIIRKENTSGSS